jgi:hypothetical protein
MIEFTRWLQYTETEVSPSQKLACQYLEREGYVFGAHFGYDNAIDKARQHWLNRKRAIRAKPFSVKGHQ